MPAIRAEGRYAVATRWQETITTAGQLSRGDDGVLTGLARGPADVSEVRRACEIAMLRAIAAVGSVVPLDEVQHLLFVRDFMPRPPASPTTPWRWTLRPICCRLRSGRTLGRRPGRPSKCHAFPPAAWWRSRSSPESADSLAGHKLRSHDSTSTGAVVGNERRAECFCELLGDGSVEGSR